MKRRKIANLDVFKGLNQSMVTKNAPEWLIGGKNFKVADDGALEKLWGTRKIYDSSGLTQITDLFIHDQESRLIFAVGNDKLKMYNDIWSEIGSSLLTGYNQVWFASYLDNPYFFFGDKAYYYNVKTATLTDLDAECKAQWIADGGAVADYIKVMGICPVVHYNSLWIAGMGEYKNVVFYTISYGKLFHDIGQGNLPFSLWVSVGGDDSASGSTYDEIVGMAEWSEELVVFKKNSVHRIIGQNSSQYSAVPVNTVVGCKFNKSIQKTKMGIIWLDSMTSGVWKYDGALTNISRPRIDAVLSTVSSNDIVRSGVYLNRYYMLTINDSTTLIYDMDLDVWNGPEDVGYGAFAKNAAGDDLFIGAINTFATSYATVTDPARGTPQSVLQRVSLSTNIVQMGKSSARNMNADGTNGSTMDFEVETPHLDFGYPANQKIFSEVLVFFKASDNLLTMDATIDGRTYDNLTGLIETHPVYNMSRYNQTAFDNFPTYRARFLMPWTACGHMMSLKLKSTTNKDLKIEGIVVNFVVKGIFKDDKE